MLCLGIWRSGEELGGISRIGRHGVVIGDRKLRRRLKIKLGRRHEWRKIVVGKYLMFEMLEVMFETLVVGKSFVVLRLRDDRDKGGVTNTAFRFAMGLAVSKRSSGAGDI
jgi:hypothetical protein